MLCKCGFENNDKAKFCSECGMKLEKVVEEKVKIPKMVSIKEAHARIFEKNLSIAKIYDLVRTKSIPHVKAGSRILLDVERTYKWWNEKLDESTKQVKINGLKRII